MRLVSEAHRDAVPIERPQLFDQPIVQFFRPLALEKRDDLLAAVHEFRTVSPSRVDGIGKCDSLRIARIAGILSQTNFLNRSLASEWRKRRTLSGRRLRYALSILLHAFYASDP